MSLVRWKGDLEPEYINCYCLELVRVYPRKYINPAGGSAASIPLRLIDKAKHSKPIRGLIGTRQN